MKIWTRNINDALEILSQGKTGGVNIIDLANINSCSFIATQDLGRVYKDNNKRVRSLWKIWWKFFMGKQPEEENDYTSRESDIGTLRGERSRNDWRRKERDRKHYKKTITRRNLGNDNN